MIVHTQNQVLGAVTKELAPLLKHTAKVSKTIKKEHEGEHVHKETANIKAALEQVRGLEKQQNQWKRSLKQQRIDSLKCLST